MTKVFDDRIWQSKGSRAAVLVSALIGFTACGGGAGGGGISGQLSGPTGSSVNQTAVAALVCKNSCQSQSDVTENVAAQVTVSATGSSASYELPNVPAGQYLVFGVQDTNGSGKLDAGDLFGAVSGVPSPAANVNIKLQPATASAVSDVNLAAMAWRLLRER